MKLNFLPTLRSLSFQRLLLVIVLLATTPIWAEELSQQEHISSHTTTLNSPAFIKEDVVLEMSSFLSLKDAATIQSQDADFLKGYFPVTAQFCSAVLNTLAPDGSDDFFYSDPVASVIIRTTDDDGLNHY